VKSLKSRKLIGAVAFGLLLLLGFGLRTLVGVSDDDWLWRGTYVVALCAAMLCAFYDRSNFSEKAWDYNPKRGVLYFLLGWVLFPVLIGVDAAFGAEIGVQRAMVGTLFLSVLAGIVGTFTENMGI
jgi:hypothetical protein